MRGQNGRVWIYVVTGVVTAAAAVVGAARGLRLRKRLAPSVRSELRALPRDRKKALVRALRRGEAVRDPRDAELGERYAAYLEQLPGLSTRWRPRRWHLLLALALAVIGAVVNLASGRVWIGALELLALAYVGAMFVVAARLRARVARAKEANRKLRSLRAVR